MPAAAALRAQIESYLAQRVPKPLEYKPLVAAERVPAGIAELDELVGGGVPRGCLTEICGATSSGRTTLTNSLLAQVTQKGEAAALIDVSDAFAPDQAAEAGVALEWLLWVRCGGNKGAEPKKKWGSEVRIEQALKITDWLLQAGGFSVIVLDLASVPPWLVRRIPLTSWFRFRRAVENTATAFVLLGEKSYAQTCASLVMRMERQRVNWSAAEAHVSSFASLTPGSSPGPESRANVGHQLERPTLLNEIIFTAEVVRSRLLTAHTTATEAHVSSFASLTPGSSPGPEHRANVGHQRFPAVSAFSAQPGWEIRKLSN